MEDFKEALVDCDLGDLRCMGSKFTLCNNREGNDFIKERLDRALVNCDWHSLNEMNHVFVLTVQSSDHNPLLISCQNRETEFLPRTKIFKYEGSWARNEECAAITKNAWICTVSAANKVEFTGKGLERCRDRLVVLSKKFHGN